MNGRGGVGGEGRWWNSIRLNGGWFWGGSQSGGHLSRLIDIRFQGVLVTKWGGGRASEGVRAIV